MFINKNIIIILFFISTLISEEIDSLIKYSAYDHNVNLIVSLFQKEYKKNEVKGVQFDISYDESSLTLNELTSLIDGSTFDHVITKEGNVRCVIFNLDGRSFNKTELSRLITMSFLQKNNFYNYTDVILKNLIVVGNFGENISSDYFPNSFRIDFNELKPRSSHIYKPENIAFKDTTIISFQLHKPSNVNLYIYDIFDLKRKILIEKYMDLGLYEVSMDSYDENQEELLEGRYKIKLIIDSIPKDSIYVVYEKNKN